MEKTNFTQMMRWVKGTVLAVVAVLGLGLNQAGAQSACYDDFTVPLGDSCEAIINVGMISNLIAGSYPAGGYRVVIASTSPNSSTAPLGEICSDDVNYAAGSSAHQTDTVYGEGTWMYGVYQWDSEKGCHQLYCWGTFKTEDKQDPHFVGDTTGLADVANTVTDESVFRQYGTYKRVTYLTWDDALASGNTFKPGIWSCWQSTNHADLDYTWPTDSSRIYDTIAIHAKETGYMSIIAASGLNSNEPGDEASFDPVVAVYDGKFDPTSPCENLIAFGESSFIPNPLAGLGFTQGLSNSSISGADQDTTDIYAPWLLHNDPVVRMNVKVAKGRTYYVLVSHREDVSPSTKDFEVYFMFDDYDGQASSGNIDSDSDDYSGSLPNAQLNISADSLIADTSFSYFEFLCSDVDVVMLPNQKTVDEKRYTGGSMWEMSGWVAGITQRYDDTYTNRGILNTAWRLQGEALLGVQDKDTTLIDLNESDLSRSTNAAAKAYMDSILYNYGFMPLVVENCDTWEVKITDTYNPYGDCGVDQAGFTAQGGGLNVSGIITRTFVVSDDGAKTDKDTAKIQLVFRNPNLYDVRLPHLTVNIDCDEIGTGASDVVGSTDPSYTGYPYVATLAGFVDLTPNNAVCNLAAGYEDVARVNTCANTYKFRREWTIYDWCRPGTSVVYSQLIKVGDWTAPVEKTAGTLTQTQNPAACDGKVTLKAPVYTDNCSATVTYVGHLYRGTKATVDQIDEELEYFSTGSGTSKSLATGNYTVIWTATDECGNVGIPDTAEIEIKDIIAPSCVIDDLRNITLTDYGYATSDNATAANRGSAYMTAARLDEGSWDNCTPEADLVKHVRRMGTTGMGAWGANVSFTCEDAGTQVLVELRVKDKAGNETICWTEILVEDKTKPTCANVPPVAYTCADIPVGDMDVAATWDPYFNDSITAPKVVTDSLCNIELENLETEAFIDQCGVGYVNRYYTVYNQYHAQLDPTKIHADTCYMQIYFYEDHDYTITFPADETVSCEGSLATTLESNDLVISEDACDLITVSIDDETFNADGEECYKVFKTYKVINWCEYVDGASAAVIDHYTGSDGNDWNGAALTLHVDYTTDNGQKTTAIDYHNMFTKAGRGENDRHSQRDTIDVDGLNTGLDTRGRSQGAGYVTDGIKNAKDGKIDTMTVGEGGYWSFTQVLKVMDNQEPTIVFAADQDSFPTYSTASSTNPLADCPTGNVVITATLSDNCNADAQVNVVEAWIDAGNDGTEQTSSFDLDVTANVSETDDVATFTHPALPQGTHRLRLVVRDGCGNVRVEDQVFEVYDAKAPTPLCIDGLAVELMPTADGSAGMASVDADDFIVTGYVPAECNTFTGYEISLVTESIEAILADEDLDGTLELTCEHVGVHTVSIVASDNKGNSDYCTTTLTVQDNVTPCSGVGAEIAGLITTEENSVVSGVEISLNADKSVVTAVDGGYFFSGLALGGDYSVAPRKDEGYLNGVSTYDLVLISKHILGVTPLASPYKLIAADVNNSNSITTLDLIQLRKLILSVDTRLANNTSWRFVPAEYSFPVASNPWAAAFPEVLNINDFDGSANGDFVAIKVGDVNNSALIDVQPRSNASFALNVEDRNVKAGNEYTVSFKATAADVEGFQVALSYSGLELVDIVEGVATADNFGTKFTGEGVLLTSWNGTAAEGELFSLVFRATQDVVLSEALSVSTRHLNAEAYNTAGEAMNVAINFNSGAVAEASFELKQNMPNPFKGETVIGFNLAEASNATLTINDVTGRVLKVVRGDFAKGANQVSIDSKELPAAGVLYYTLTAGEYTATKKMIIIE